MITINLILILKIISASWIITMFEPIGWMIDKMKDGMLKWFFHSLSGCAKCISFWITLFVTFNVWQAIFTFFLVAALLRHEKFQYFNKKIRDTIWINFQNWRMKYYIRKCEKLLKKINEDNGL